MRPKLTTLGAALIKITVAGGTPDDDPHKPRRRSKGEKARNKRHR